MKDIGNDNPFGQKWKTALLLALIIMLLLLMIGIWFWYERQLGKLNEKAGITQQKSAASKANRLHHNNLTQPSNKFL